MRSALLVPLSLVLPLAWLACGDSVDSVDVAPAETRIVVDDTVRLTATVRTSDGKILTDRTVTWESDNTAAASVDAEGLVTAEGNGDATITATADGISGTAAVTAFTPSVLVLSNDGGVNSAIVDSFPDNMDNLTFDSLDVGGQTPNVAFLRQYDVVLLFEDGLFTNATNVGDSVAAYYAAGGNVVLGTFYWQDRSDNVVYAGSAAGWGDLEAVDPFLGPEGSEYREDSVDVATIVDHPMTAGLTRLWVDSFHGGVAAKPGTTVLAFWSDNCTECPAQDAVPMLGFRTGSAGQRMVGVSVAPGYPNYGGYEGDFYTLWGNVLRWAAAGGPGPAVSAAAPVVWRVAATAQPAARAVTRASGARR